MTGTHLRRVENDDRPALEPEALQERGNELVTRARKAAIEAIGASMHSEFVKTPRTMQPRDIRQWRARARQSITAWREVESACTELLNEVERAETASRAGMKQVVVPDASGKPGHYTTAWVKADAPDEGPTR